MDSRTRLLDLSVGIVEDVCRGRAPRDGHEGFSPEFQIALPYRGLFVWHVGGDDVVADANQLVFVRGGEPFRVTTDGFAELIVTPDAEVLSEIAHANGLRLFDHPLFRRRTWRADPRLQSFRTRFLHWLKMSESEPLQAEELVLDLIRASLQLDRRPVSCGPASARRIRRAKEFLQARLSTRIRLEDVARAAGASPAYLTDLFRRVEGISLHQYLMQLRLAHALVELPHTSDLTALALDLGFSSHSHFSSAFRRGFGCTPSQFRESTRPALRPAVTS